MQQIFKVTNVGAIEQITSKKDGSTTMQQRAEKANLVGPSQVKRDQSKNDQVSEGTFGANVPTSGDKRRGKLSRSVCVKRDPTNATNALGNIWRKCYYYTASLKAEVLQ